MSRTRADSAPVNDALCRALVCIGVQPRSHRGLEAFLSNFLRCNHVKALCLFERTPRRFSVCFRNSAKHCTGSLKVTHFHVISLVVERTSGTMAFRLNAAAASAASQARGGRESFHETKILNHRHNPLLTAKNEKRPLA